MREAEGLREALRKASALCDGEGGSEASRLAGIKAILGPYLEEAVDAPPPGPVEIAALADATWQLLDDMGVDGQSVCLAAKAKARVAYEPFRQEGDDGIMPLERAEGILAGLERGR